jgi:hypothetical protein
MDVVRRDIESKCKLIRSRILNQGAEIHIQPLIPTTETDHGGHRAGIVGFSGALRTASISGN